MMNSTNTVIRKASGAAMSAKACGHIRHAGCCACCQRAQLARWTMQLTEATARPQDDLTGDQPAHGSSARFGTVRQDRYSQQVIPDIPRGAS